jgi:hypothetical protein
MSTIITRQTGDTAKGSPLTNTEIDTNFINLNDDKVEVTKSETAPENPTEKMFWLKSSTGALYTWYVVNEVGQWVSFQSIIV